MKKLDKKKAHLTVHLTAQLSKFEELASLFTYMSRALNRIVWVFSQSFMEMAKSSVNLVYPNETNHNIENLLVSINYPGRVENPEKAVETLGGSEEISNVSFVFVK